MVHMRRCSVQNLTQAQRSRINFIECEEHGSHKFNVMEPWYIRYYGEDRSRWPNWVREEYGTKVNKVGEGSDREEV